MQGVANHPTEIFLLQRLERNFRDRRSFRTQGGKFLDQPMVVVYLVLSVRPDDQNACGLVGMDEQLFDEVEACAVDPLQIVQEQNQRMIRPCEQPDEISQNRLKASRCLGWRQVRRRRCRSQHETQFRNEIHHRPGVRS
ncbi:MULTISPECIES: hypothetical protein [Rhizobium/Agrobacterium group]|uniref:hypothetical protein n=1 Tax=Rhizobium/Agrobacterium group TaxID=227290 RepID=UPI001FDF19B4|nr:MULTISPECIES: hypothetical protein [Rhizobium/Agrobacterium group]